MDYNITLPFTKEQIQNFEKLDVLYLTGVVYTARDAAHKRMYEAVEKAVGKTGSFSPEEILKARQVLPFDIEGAVIYYLGPTPAKPGQVIGSAGPTTASRMDKYTPMLLELGLTGMIAKGRRSEAVTDSIHTHRAIYLGATGGAGALLSKCIKKCEVIAYDDLGTEAVRKLYVENLPVTVLEV